jgi:hypothetical protein
LGGQIVNLNLAPHTPQAVNANATIPPTLTAGTWNLDPVAFVVLYSKEPKTATISDNTDVLQGL